MNILNKAGAICFILFLSISCKKETLAPTVTLNETVNTMAVTVKMGDFISGPFGTVSGKAELYKQDSTYAIKLTSFSTTNGPALHVYLSQEAMPVNFIDLGVLKSTNGNQVYTIAGKPDFNLYKFISIHCVAYNHLFGSAIIN